MDTHADLHALFTAATQPDPSAAAAALMALQGRTGAEVVAATLEHLDAAHAPLRAVAAEVAGQLELDEDNAAKVCAVFGNRMLLEKSAMVLAALTAAAQRFDSDAILEPLLALADHSDPRVREGVVFGLMGREEAPCVAALVGLSGDDSEGVRTWATCALGGHTEADDPTVRAALVSRLTDPSVGCRVEAIAGLARRHAPEAVEPLRVALQEVGPDPMLLEAAASLGDPTLQPVLDGLRSHPELTPWLTEALDEAFARCDPDAEV